MIPVPIYFRLSPISCIPQERIFTTRSIPDRQLVLEQYIYSSSYDLGEFWSSNFSTQTAPVSDDQNNLFIYNSGPAANLKFGAAGCSDTLRNIQVKVNNILFKDTALNDFNDIVSNVTIPLSSLNTSSTSFQFINNSQAFTYADRLVVSFYELTYPRQFNFGGQANFSFQLPAKASGYFLKISDFNQGAAIPVLYDRATGQRFAPLLRQAFTTFVLPGMQLRQKSCAGQRGSFQYSQYKFPDPKEFCQPILIR